MRNRKALVGLLLAMITIVGSCTDDDAGTTATTAPASTTVASTTTTASAATTVPPVTTTTEGIPPIVVWGDATAEAAVEAAATAFTAETGIPVEFVLKDSDAILAGITDDATDAAMPDLFWGPSDWAGPLADAGLIDPIELESFGGDFFDVGRHAFTIDGRLYGLPVSINEAVLYRNTAMVPTVPGTYTELLAACEPLADEIENCIGIPVDDPLLNLAFIVGRGGYLLGYDDGLDAGDVGLDSDGATAAATWLDAQVKESSIRSDLDQTAARDLFDRGLQAFLWDGPDQAARISEDITYDVSPFPAVDGLSPFPFLRASGFFASRPGAESVITVTFLVEYLTGMEPMTSSFEASGLPPAHIEAYRGAATDGSVLATLPDPASVTSTVLAPNTSDATPALEFLGDALATIYGQSYTDDLADAAAVMTDAAIRIREQVTS